MPATRAARILPVLLCTLIVFSLSKQTDANPFKWLHPRPERGIATAIVEIKPDEVEMYTRTASDCNVGLCKEESQAARD